MDGTTKNLLLIGASKGLGLAIASEYLERDWRVIATELNHSLNLHALSESSRGRLEIEGVDVTSPSSGNGSSVEA